MSDQMLVDVAIGMAVFGWLLYRQLRTRAVKTEGNVRVLLIMGVIGVVQLGQFVDRVGSIGLIGIGSLLVSLSAAAVLSAVRGYSVHIWQTAEGWWRRGTAVTLVLWFVSIGLHIGIDVVAGWIAGPSADIGGLGNATLLLYLAMSLGLQNIIVARRVAARSQAQSAVSPW